MRGIVEWRSQQAALWGAGTGHEIVRGLGSGSSDRVSDGIPMPVRQRNDAWRWDTSAAEVSRQGALPGREREGETGAGKGKVSEGMVLLSGRWQASAEGREPDAAGVR